MIDCNVTGGFVQVSVVKPTLELNDAEIVDVPALTHRATLPDIVATEVFELVQVALPVMLSVDPSL